MTEATDAPVPRGGADPKRKVEPRRARKILFAVLTATFVFGVGSLLFILLLAEPLSRMQARHEYRERARDYNGTGWLSQPEVFFRSYVATPNHPIEFRLRTNISRTIPQLDGVWKRRTNSTDRFLNHAWHLVGGNGAPQLYLVHRFVPRSPRYPSLGGRWEGLTASNPVALLPWVADCLDGRQLPAEVMVATNQSNEVISSDRWRLVIDYRRERGELTGPWHWRLSPSTTYVGMPEAHRTWTHRLNEHGFRRGTPPGEQAERILFIGDSMLFGWGLAEHETLTEVLEAGCRQAGLDVEMTNCGVPGYNTRQQFYCLTEQFDRVSPRAVVLCYCANDAEPPMSLPFSRPERYYRHVAFDSWFLERCKKPVRHLMLAAYRAVNNGLANVGIDSEWARAFPVQRFWPKSSGHIGRMEVMRGWRKGVKPRESREALEDIKAFCEAEGVPLLMCILPAFTGPVERYPLTPIHTEVAGWARELSIPCVDLLPEFSAEKDWKSLRVWKKDSHPSAKSVKIFARRLLPQVRELGRK